jgi:hypothetical protein
MKTFALFLFACVLTSAYAQKKSSLPRDGNSLLDSCNAMVDAADNPSSLSSLSGDRFAEKLGQLNWCAGYLGAMQDVLVQVHVNLILMPLTKVTLEGPDKAKAYWLDNLNVACVPDDKVPILQLARIVTKWLREHPERLHELKGTLTIAALRDAFPCQQAAPEEATKPKK